MGNKVLDKKLEEFQNMSDKELENKEQILESMDYEKLEKKLFEMNVEPLQQNAIEKTKVINGKIKQLTQKLEKAMTEKEKAEIIIKIEEWKAEKVELTKGIEEAKQRVHKEVKTRQAELKYIEGYKKNKIQIDKINQYKDKTKIKLDTVVEKRKNTEEKIKKFEKIVEQQKKDKLEELDNNQYSEHFENIEILERTKKELLEISKKEELYKSMISKCDLAWKTLFSNKTWEDIQIRATKGRYINKTTEEDKFKEKHPHLAKIRDFFIRDKVYDYKKTDDNENGKNIDNEPQQSDTKQIAEYDKFKEKHPNLAKIRDFFIRDKVYDYKKIDDNEELRRSVDSKDATLQSGKKLENKDAFLEQLRVMVEPEGKKDKENAYIELHKQREQQEER